MKRLKIRSATRTSRVLVVAATLVLPQIGLVGCAGVHFYDEQGDKASQEVHTNLTEAGLSKAIVAERERVASITARELDVVRRQSQVRRNAALLIPIGGRNKEKTWTSLDKKIRSRIGELAGVRSDLVVADLFLLESAEKSLQAANETHMITGGIRLSCPVTSKAPTDVVQKTTFDAYSTACKKYTALNVKLKQKKGAIGGLIDKIDKVEKAKMDLENDISKLSEEYEQAYKDYKNRVKDGNESVLEEEIEQLKAHLKKFDTAATVAGGVLKPLGYSNLKLEANIAKLEKERALLNDTIDAFSKGAVPTPEDLPEDSPEHQQIAFTLGVVAGELSRAANFPQLSAMLLQNGCNTIKYTD